MAGETIDYVFRAQGADQVLAAIRANAQALQQSNAVVLQAANAAKQLAASNETLARQRVAEAVRQQATATRENAAAQTQATRSAEQLFRTNAALSQQRVRETLQAEAQAAREKAQADAIAAKQAEQLFQTQARLSQQRVRDQQAEAQALANLSKSLNSNQAETQRFVSSLGLTATTAQTATDRIRQLSESGADNATKFRTLKNELGLTATQFNQLNQAALTTTQGLQAISAASAAVGTAIAAAFAKGTQDFLAFDNALRQSGVIGGSLGTEEFQGLREEVERLGIVTSKTPQEIAAVTVSLSRAGFTAEETTNALEGIVRGSEASAESLETVGDIIAKTTRAFGLNTNETLRISDSLVAAANNTNTSINGLGESLKFVSPVAVRTNQSLEDTLIVLGLLGDAGLQGGNAGRNFASALDRLAIASAASDTELKGLVRGSAQAARAVQAIGLNARDSEGNLRPITEIIPELKAGLDGLSQGDQDLVLKALFGTEGSRAIGNVLNVLERTPERIQLVTDAVNNASGVATESGQALLQGFGGALSLLEGSLGAFSVKVGELSGSVFEPLVRASIGVVNSFLALPAPIQKVLLATTAFTGVLAGAIAALTAYTAINGNYLAAQTLATAATLRDNAALVGKQALLKAAAASQAFLTLATERDLIATGANTLATARDTIARTAQSAATNVQAAAQQAYAIATGQATAAQTAQIAAFTRAATVAGALAGAIAAIALNFEIVKTARAETDRLASGVDKVSDSVARVNEVLNPSDLQSFTSSLEDAIRKFDATANLVGEGTSNFLADATIQARKNAQDIEDEITGLAGVFNDFLTFLDEGGDGQRTGFLTNLTDAAVSDAEAAFDGIIRQIEAPGGLQDTFNQIAARGFDIPDAVKEEFTQAIEDQIAVLEQSRPVTEADVIAKQNYIEALRQMQAQLSGTAEATAALTEESEAAAAATAEQIAQAKELLDQQNQQNETNISRQQEDERIARERALADELAAIQEESQTRIENLQRQNQEELAAFQEEQQTRLQEQEAAFNEEQQAFQEEGQRRIQEQERAFSDEQQARQEEFQRAEQEIQRVEQENFDRQQTLIDRQLELEQVKNTTLDRQTEQLNEELQRLDRERELALADPQDRAGLRDRFRQEDEQARRAEAIDRQQAQRRQQIEQELLQLRFEQEDQLAARRQELEAPLQEQRLAADEARRERERAFNAEQEQRQENFERTVLTPLRQQLEDTLNQRKLAFEQNVLAPLRRQQEQQLEALKLQQESAIAALKQATEDEIASRRQAAADQERALDRQFEDERRAREAAFKEQQRALDTSNAEQIAQILASASPTPTATPPTNLEGRFLGGDTEAGQAYKVGETGPEIFVAPRNGWILNATQAKAIASQALPSLFQAPTIAAPPVAAVMVRNEGGGDRALIAELQQLRGELRAVRAAGRPNQEFVFTENNQDTMRRVFALMKAGYR